MPSNRADPAVIARLDQFDAAGRDLHDALQAYIDKLDRQIAWHARWDKWIVRAVGPVLLLLIFGVSLAVQAWV